MKQSFNGSFSAAEIENLIQYHLRYSLGYNDGQATAEAMFRALALTLRERLVDGMSHTEERYRQQQSKRLCYLSMEYLIGSSLRNNLSNLGLLNLYKEVLWKMDIDFDSVCDAESDAALGNGGLGRLATCFLDSLATLSMPAVGYGINYEFGLFKQRIVNGYQKERPDRWLGKGSPWQIERPDAACLIPVYGQVELVKDQFGNYQPVWLNWELIIGVPCDMPIIGYGGNTINRLRLYSSKSAEEFDIEKFNQGDYLQAVEHKIFSERISKVLYPSDSVIPGQELRLIQEYFLVACSLRDILRQQNNYNHSIGDLPQNVAIQLNDTHPALAVAELMRLLIDEHKLDWETAWDKTVQTLGYTNHTLLPEALEKWPVPLFERVLPRHLQIIFDINQRFLRKVMVAFPGNQYKLREMSIIEETEPKQVRMAYLSIIGSHSINGVAALHSELIKSQLVPNFHDMWPDRFNNKTNGVSQRRWLLNANPRLAQLINGSIGDTWTTDLYNLQQLEAFVDDAGFLGEIAAVKQANKERLAAHIGASQSVTIDPTSIFDVQIKRIHEYKRQLLNALHIIHLYLQIVDEGLTLTQPRTHIFAGKAAAGYREAKLIIKLINNVADIVNKDPRVKDQLKVIFLPNYNVSLGEKIFPAADISEQISTAGMEASGTGNMKFALNGALTVGTLDGANIEIRHQVGPDNIFIFGLNADEIQELRDRCTYQPAQIYRDNPCVRQVIDAIRADRFSENEKGIFHSICDKILDPRDYYFHLADFESYRLVQANATSLFGEKQEWHRKALKNIARSGFFSSDRTVREYAEEIWGIEPVADLDDDGTTGEFLAEKLA